MNLDSISRRIEALQPPPDPFAVVGYTTVAGAARVACGTNPGTMLTPEEVAVLTARGLPEWPADAETIGFMTGSLVAMLRRLPAMLPGLDAYQCELLSAAWRDNAVLPRCDAPARDMLIACGYKP